MKSAALIFGVIAGLLGVGVFVLGNIDSGLAGVAALGPDHAAIARMITYLVPAVCWLGAGLALGYPRLGGLVLLISAAAWAAIAFLAGHGAVFFAAAPFIFAAAGGLVALFARRPAKPLPAVNSSADVDDVIAEAVTATEPSRRALPPQRSVPTRVDARLPPVRRDEASVDIPPATRIPPPFQDIFPEQEPLPDSASIEAGAPTTRLPEAVSEAEPEVENLPTEPPVAAAEPTDDAVVAVAAPHPRRPNEWKLPTPAATPAPVAPRYAADRQTADPARIEPLAPAALPAPDQRPRGVSALDFGASNDFSARRDGTYSGGNELAEGDRFGRRQIADETPAFKPDAPSDKARRGGGVRRVLRLLIALLFILVLLGIAAAVYLDYRRGAQSILFGRHTHPLATARTTTAMPPAAPSAPAGTSPAAPAVAAPLAPVPAPASQPAVVHSPLPAAPASSPAPTVSTPTPPPAAAPAPVQPTPAIAPAPMPATPAALPPSAAATPSPPAPAAPVATADNAASPTSFTDPNAYCAAVGTIAAPDARYTGPSVPRAVTAALVTPPSTPPDQIHWRCANGAAFACSAHNTNECMPTPTVEGMVSYCAQHADAKGLPAPNGSWSCNGTRPVIPEDQSWPVDAQGFFPGAWIRVPPAG